MGGGHGRTSGSRTDLVRPAVTSRSPRGWIVRPSRSSVEVGRRGDSQQGEASARRAAPRLLPRETALSPTRALSEIPVERIGSVRSMGSSLGLRKTGTPVGPTRTRIRLPPAVRKSPPVPWESREPVEPPGFVRTSSTLMRPRSIAHESGGLSPRVRMEDR